MKSHLILALGVWLSATAAHADQNDDDREQVIQNASKGQSAETSAQVREFAESHRDEISGITQGYRAYINQIQAMTNDDCALPAASGTNAPVAAQPAARTAPAAVEPQTGLQTASLQPSSGLTTSHLDGSTPLPDAPPVSSLLHPTPEQLQQGSATQAAMQARKRSLMQTPLHYQD